MVLTQKKYIHDLLEHLVSYGWWSQALQTGFRYFSYSTLYRSVVGSLQYATLTQKYPFLITKFVNLCQQSWRLIGWLSKNFKIPRGCNQLWSSSIASNFSQTSSNHCIF
uniref:Retrovirus-related Pol polyprotein from transposon TNT 1-94 n=1 Tax=Cajanus cajan TaxID=3821 RepID=A0A151STE6_CAJCA|nr:hypothetical protein KK1_004319 [Cajanus cajan]